jgi:hypothetical protein
MRARVRKTLVDLIAASVPDSTAQPPITLDATASATEPLKLGYAHGSAGEERPHRWARAIGLLLILPAAVTPFVPFIYEVSPLRAMNELFAAPFSWHWTLELALGLLAAPFFLGPPLVLWHLRLLVASHSTRGERITLWSLSVLSVAASLLFISTGTWELLTTTGGADRQPVVCASGASIIAGGTLMLFNPLARRLRLSREGRATLALSTGYLANAAMLLIGFAGEAYELGAWLTVVACVGIVALWPYFGRLSCCRS